MKRKNLKKPSMRSESNVGMVKGNKISNNYTSGLKFITNYKKCFQNQEIEMV